jgi:photosynthetic reaction center H subunit
VLVPVHFVDVNFRARTITIKALRADQFASVPGLRNPDSVTLQEEEKIAAFYGGGTLYATAARTEPLI